MDILDKLRNQILQDISNECQVLYILAEIRKYLDSNNTSNSKYSNLYFYCNWVLHIKMDRTPAKVILKRFETYIDKNKDLKEISKIFIKKEADFYLLTSLRRELKDFFRENNLPNQLLVDKNWSKFKQLLIEILKDCPLINNNGKINKFSFVQGPDKQIRFRVNIKGKGSFKITLKNRYNRV